MHTSLEQTVFEVFYENTYVEGMVMINACYQSLGEIGLWLSLLSDVMRNSHVLFRSRKQTADCYEVLMVLEHRAKLHPLNTDSVLSGLTLF
jgi:hypothetical protein